MLFASVGPILTKYSLKACAITVLSATVLLPITNSLVSGLEFVLFKMNFIVWFSGVQIFVYNNLVLSYLGFS